MKNHTPCKEGIISWSIKSSKRKQNKSKANIILLSSSEQNKKIKAAGKKHSYKKTSTVNKKKKILLENNRAFLKNKVVRPLLGPRPLNSLKYPLMTHIFWMKNLVNSRYIILCQPNYLWKMPWHLSWKWDDMPFGTSFRYILISIYAVNRKST